MKKYIFWALVLVFALMPLHKIRAAQDPAGTNVILNNTIYFINANNQLQPYTSAGAFLSYGFNSFASAVQASAEDSALQQGSFVPPQDGALINDSGTIYLISKGQRAGFASAAVFTELGYSFANALPGDTSFLKTLPPITTASQAHPADTLINLNGTIFLMTSLGRVAIPSMDVFNSWGYALSRVVPGNQYDSAVQVYSANLPMRPVGGLSAYAYVASQGSGSSSSGGSSGSSGSTPPANPVAPVAPVAADTTPPKIYIATPVNNQTVGGTAVSVTAVASDNVGVTKVQFSVNGQLQGDPVTVAPYTISIDATKYYDTTYTIGATAYDAAGNTAFDQVSVKIDNSPNDPIVTISPVITNIQVGQTQQFTAAVANSTANQAVTWEINGSTSGDPYAGGIAQDGTYTAPSWVTSAGPVYATITAISQVDTSKQASIIVQILPATN